MTPKNPSDPLDEDSLGVLDDAASVDTAVIGILGGTAQVSVVLPQDDDDELEDDGVLDGEVVADLIIDEVTIEGVKLPEALSAEAFAPIDAQSVAPISASAASAAKSEAEPPASETPASAVRKSAPTPSAPKKPKKKPAVVADVPDEIVVDAVVEDATGPQAVVDAPVETITDADIVEEPSATEPVTEPAEVEPAVPEPAVAEPTVAEPDAVTEPTAEEEAEVAARFLAKAVADAPPLAPEPTVIDEAVIEPVSTETVPSDPEPSTPTSMEKEATTVPTPEEKAVVTQPTRAAARAEVTLTSKRLDDLSEAGRESADLLTADRLLDPHRVTKPEPEGAWSHLLYTVSGRRINIGDGKRARDRKALSARIAAPISGGARFIPVLSRKGGVGKTTITALLGMALADAREDRVIAVDANPDRGTLADRVVRPHHSKSVRDLVRIHDEVRGYHDISAIVARDATRLDVLASDSDPRIAEAFSDADYRDVAGVAAHYYSLVLTDTGTGIVHSVMAATLDLADQIVIVSGLSVDEARLASETLTWLETNGYAEQARGAIVVLNQSTPGAPLVRLNELESHFATRAKRVVRMPYDAQIAGGGTIVFANLQPETRKAARELAALLVEGLRSVSA